MMRLLSRHAVDTADHMGWAALSNGNLLTAAESSGFECMVTADQNIQHQQHLARRRLAIVVLSTNAWNVIKRMPDVLVTAVDRARPGSYETVTFPCPPLVRGRWVPPPP